METILIVDDDSDLCNQIAYVLRDRDWAVEIAYCGADATTLLKSKHVDFILLDWNLPDISGLDLCKQLRGSGCETPIIFLTGRNSIDDKELGLDSGGDDYICKPFHVRELLARIRTIKRRPPNLLREPIEVRGLTLIPPIRIARMNDREVQLTQLESAILEFFMRHRDNYFSAEQLFESVWPADTNASTDETVRVHMRLLRSKLEQLGIENLIVTVRGSGYILRDKSLTSTQPH
jgi:OmpR-family two-component system manganese-sensing response regulator